ncbi:hypothetical protein AM499_09785 [Bacillus sp. FJAT-22090]|nr:hypothetical protein AM499_09785 [Bacillus sp. FJAT-22090]
MKFNFQLVKFFIASFYSKPQQLALYIMLLIAMFYLALQYLGVNIMIYFLGTSEEYLFYNLFLSMGLTYILTAYFAVSVVYNQRDFYILSSLPISAKQIVIAKVISGLALPIIIVGILQIPIYLLLFLKYDLVEIVQTVVILTLTNVITAMFLLSILSILNRFRKLFPSSLLYLFTNTILAFLIGIIPIIYLITQQFEKIKAIIVSFNVTDLTDFFPTLANLLNMGYRLSMQETFIKTITTSLLTKDSLIDFLIIVSNLILICILLLIATVKNTAVNYYKNGLLENRVEKMPKISMYRTKNIWGYYLQREFWIIQSEPYFKMQIILTLILSPLFTIIFTIVVQMDLLKSQWIADNESHLFAYMILFFSCVNNISGTPYSREGKNYAPSIAIPLDRRKVFLAKVTTASLISILSVLISYAIYMLFGSINTLGLLLLLITVLLIISYNLLSPIYDMQHPLLEWKSPSEAVKSNPNVLISLVYGFPILIVITFIHFCLLALNVSQWVVTIIIAVLTIGSTITLFFKVLGKYRFKF